MKKRWISWAVLCGFCLAAPVMVSAQSQNNANIIQVQSEDASDTIDSEEKGDTEISNTPIPGEDDKKDESYQAIESTNARGLKVITNPLWEYNKASKRYRLVKRKTAEGAPTYYTLRDGVLQLGKRTGYYYAFDAKGDMITKTKIINGVRYYFTPKSKAIKSAASVTPNQTTLGMAMKNCWMKVNQSWFYFNRFGQRDLSKKGLQKINGSYYYLNKTSIPYTSKWIKQKGGAWWYFGKNGKYNSNRIHSQKINGSYYYLNKKGIPYKKCFKTVNNKKYYYGASGKRANYSGWKTIKNKKYYFNSKSHYVEIKTGLQVIGGKTYYFSAKGNMYSKSWANINGRRYYFKKNGQMATTWTKINGTYYYFRTSGSLDAYTVAKMGSNYYFVTGQGTRGANILDGTGVSAAMDSGTKLRTCFNYVVRNCRYGGGTVWPPRGWEPYHAYKMLTMRIGNCYDFAAAFCYLAKAVGYENAFCVAGQCASASGGFTPHSWCEINGLVYDPEISYESGYYLFGTPYGGLPFAYIR